MRKMRIDGDSNCNASRTTFLSTMHQLILLTSPLDLLHRWSRMIAQDTPVWSRRHPTARWQCRPPRQVAPWYDRALEHQTLQLPSQCRRSAWPSVLSSKDLPLQPSLPTTQDPRSQRITSGLSARAQRRQFLKKTSSLRAVDRPNFSQHHQSL